MDIGDWTHSAPWCLLKHRDGRKAPNLFWGRRNLADKLELQRALYKFLASKSVDNTIDYVYLWVLLFTCLWHQEVFSAVGASVRDSWQSWIPCYIHAWRKDPHRRGLLEGERARTALETITCVWKYRTLALGARSWRALWYEKNKEGASLSNSFIE